MTPEGIESLKRITDQIQAALEAAYGLGDLNLLKASKFIYPEVTSKMAEHNLDVNDWTDSGFFVTDADTEEGIKEEVKRKLLRKQAFRESVGLTRNPDVDKNLGIGNETTLRLAGRFPIPWRRSRSTDLSKSQKKRFADLHPVIYISPDIITQTKMTGRYSEMLAANSFRALDVITEEVGHFLYEQVQHNLYGEVAGDIIGEGMALIDNYQVLKSACEEMGQNIFDPTNALVKEIVTQFVEKISARGEIRYQVMDAGGYNPTASKYTKSVEVMGGFIKHLVGQNSQGNSVAQELSDFYRMTGPQKGRYLRSLYTNYVQKGDNWYEKPLVQLKDKIEFEYEFEDEDLWREKWERVKNSPIAHIIDPF